jgi:hypothetical protein
MVQHRIADGVLARTVGESVVLFNSETERLLSLNACGSRIWQLLSEGTSDREIIERLVEEFDGVSSQIERETCLFLAELEAERLIQPES